MTSIKQMPLKKDRMTLTREQLRSFFGEDTLYIFVLRLERLVVIGRMDGNRSIEEEAAEAAVKFGSEMKLPPEIHTLSGPHIQLSKKWLEEAGRTPGDLAFAVTSRDDPRLMAIQFLGAEDLLSSTVRSWIDHLGAA